LEPASSICSSRRLSHACLRAICPARGTVNLRIAPSKSDKQAILEPYKDSVVKCNDNTCYQGNGVIISVGYTRQLMRMPFGHFLAD